MANIFRSNNNGAVLYAVDTATGKATHVTATNHALDVNGSGGGGGAVTVADGADVAEGATTDAAVTAGATGTVSGKLRTISADLSSVKANQTNATQKTQIVDGSGNVIASTSNALNVSAVLTAGAATIGSIASITTSVTPGAAAANLGKAEDAVHGSGDVGVMALAVRNDTASVLAANGDYMPPTTDEVGALWMATVGRISTANSSTANLAGGAVFTGTGEEVKNYAAIQVSVFSSHASATDGLSLQQSSDNTNWDVIDTYTIVATTGKVFSIQPAARYFRLVYTNGATLTTSLRIQTVYHTEAPNPSSQRSADAYTNETDLTQAWTFNSLYNGVTWDRVREAVNALNSVGTGVQAAQVVGQFDDVAPTSITENQFGNLRMSANRNLYGTIRDAAGNERGLNVSAGGNISVDTVTTVTTLTGTTTLTPGTGAGNLGKAEDAVAGSGDTGVAIFGVRNDALTSAQTNATGDYGSPSVDTSGILMVAGAPRALKGTFQVQLSNTTTETTILAATASTFHDLYGIILANTGATTTKVSIRDDTAGTVRMIIEVPTLETRGFMLPLDSAVPQTAVNKNLTAQCASATTSLEVTGFYVSRV